MTEATPKGAAQASPRQTGAPLACAFLAKAVLDLKTTRALIDRPLAFATINAKFRADATSIFTLARNIGQAVGISLVTVVLANMVQVNHAELGSYLTATSAAVATQLPALLAHNLQILSIADQLVSQQAAMIAYLDDFVLMMYVTLAAIPIVFLLRGDRPKAGSRAPVKTAEERALERAHAMAE